MQRKAIFFTATSILIVSFILSAFAYPTYVSQKYEVDAIKTRVDVANNHVADLRNIYLPRTIRVSGYRALYALTDYVKSGGSISDEADLNDLFKEVLLEGTISGVEQDIMSGYSLFEKLDEIQKKSSDALRLRTSFTKDYDRIKVKVYQSELTGPFSVGINVTINYTVNVIAAFWNKSEEIEAIFSFEGLSEPLLISPSKAGYENVIRQRNNTALNITGFYYHVNSMTYDFNKNAPSYLQRFYNDFSASECCGMETMINPDKISVPDAAKPFADWCAYSDVCSGNLYYVNCITSEFSEFKINPGHGAHYNISAYLYPLDGGGSCSESPWPP